MPGQSVTLHVDQGVSADLILKDSAGAVTNNLGTYTVAWSTDAPNIIAIQEFSDPHLGVKVQAPIPAVEGTGNVVVTLTSSDSAKPVITNSFGVTFTSTPPPPPGEVASVDFAIGLPGVRLF